MICQHFSDKNFYKIYSYPPTRGGTLIVAVLPAFLVKIKALTYTITNISLLDFPSS